MRNIIGVLVAVTATALLTYLAVRYDSAMSAAFAVVAAFGTLLSMDELE